MSAKAAHIVRFLTLPFNQGISAFPKPVWDVDGIILAMHRPWREHLHWEQIMAEPKTNRTPIERKPAFTGDHVKGRKDEAIRSEIERDPNITARQIAENLENRGMRVSMSHIYRQLSNYTHRTKATAIAS
jgi:hypothetical protein